MNRIDWNVAYQFFIATSSLSYRDVAEKFNINYDYVKEIGAREKWVEKRDLIQKAALNLMEERTVGEVAKRNIEHIKQSRLLEGSGIEAIADKGLRPQTFMEAVKAIEIGQQLERTALGMDQKVSPKVKITNSEGRQIHVVWGNGSELSSYDQRRQYEQTTNTNY
ncbi:MAG TPA: hypothetical protein VGT05_05180 [Patescibacteria group bacterium]|nr:hypothetical protein [Patescibacteria group bacterium]